jgi:hypothetical protein
VIRLQHNLAKVLSLIRIGLDIISDSKLQALSTAFGSANLRRQVYNGEIAAALTEAGS